MNADFHFIWKLVSHINQAISQRLLSPKWLQHVFTLNGLSSIQEKSASKSDSPGQVEPPMATSQFLLDLASQIHSINSIHSINV